MTTTVRTMRRDELDLAIDLAAAEGWNPGLHDADAFWAADPGGFLVAEVDGEVAGCISAVRYGSEFGFIGLFIVLPHLRGHGIGSALWATGADQLIGRLVGLDGVPDQQPYYRRKGFTLAWQNARYGGTAPASQPTAPTPPAVVPLRTVDVEMLRADDRRVFPAARDSFLDAWTGLPDATGLAWMEDGRLLGWGVIRASRTGHKVGPLVADEPRVAAALFDALAGSVPPGSDVFLDVPLPNHAALELARSRGLTPGFETARMYTGQAPAVELDRVYGVCTFELG
jgi:GNAT superfamily N-acetyltransferase